MQSCAASGVILTLILWISSPALACLAKPEKMTAAEMRCCREMAGQCGEMAKAEHSCCPKTPAKLETSRKVVLAASEGGPIAANPSITHLSIEPLAASSFEQCFASLFPTYESPPGAVTPIRI